MADNNVPLDRIVQLLDLYKRSLKYICERLEEPSLKDDILPNFPDLSEEQTVSYPQKDMYETFQATKQQICDRWKIHAVHAKKADDCKPILKTLWKSRKIRSVKENLSNIDIPEELKKSQYIEHLKALTTLTRLLHSKELEQNKNEVTETLVEEKSHGRKEECEQKTPTDNTHDSDNDDIQTTSSSVQTDVKSDQVRKTATKNKQLVEKDKTSIDKDTKEEQADENCNAESEKRENVVTDVPRPSDLGDKTSTETNDEPTEPMDTTEYGERMEIDDTLRVADKVSQSIYEKEKEVTALSEKLDSLKQKYKTSKQEIKELKQKIEEKESVLSQLEENFREMQDSMAQISQHNEQLIQDLESIQKVPDGKLKKQIVSLEKALKNSREQTEKFSRLCGEKEQAYLKLLKEQKLIEKSAQRPKTAPGRQYQEMQNLVDSLKGEKESLMQRLSMVAGMKMKDNNPAIADLSDPNRPEKLAEQFREIYDNAWTDVLDYITENTEATDEIAVKLIVDVLKLMYDECRGNIHRRKLRMIKSIGYTEEVLIKQYTGGKEGHNPVVKLIKDLVRDSVERISDEVTRKTKELQDAKKVIEDGGKHGDLFVTKCIKLCLYMCTQDPPVILDFNIKNGDIFDKDRLSPFTASGDVIDYLVWPIMCLSDRGVLMSKGIAQGKKGGDK